MNLERRISRLNRLLSSELGYVGSQPRYAWKRAADLFYLMQEGYRPASKLIVGPVLPNYIRHCWAERLGNVWVLAKWDYPRVGAAWNAQIIKEDSWREEFGDEFPYPEKGQLYAIPETKMLPNEEPTEFETRAIIASIKEQESANVKELTETLRAEAEQPFADQKKESDDRIDSDWPAFDNCNASEEKLGQARGGHVSFGGI